MAGPGEKPLIPWDAVIAFGLGRLRLSPEQFWALSFREFGLLLPKGEAGPGAPITRTNLDDLTKRYPDGEQNAQ